MASSFPLLSSLSILFLATTVLPINITQATSTIVVTKDLVPCTMCTECDNPCQPLPPPPPPVVECPPPPSPPPPSPPPRPVVVECPPPPKTTACQNCELPQGPPQPQYPPGLYYPPGNQYPYYVPDNVKNSGEKIKPLHSVYFTKSFIYLACLCLPYYLFI